MMDFLARCNSNKQTVARSSRNHSAPTGSSMKASKKFRQLTSDLLAKFLIAGL